MNIHRIRLFALLASSIVIGACSEPTSAPPNLDASTATIRIGRSILQLRDEADTASWATARFVHTDYDDPARPYDVIRRGPFGVRSIDIDRDTLGFWKPDSLIYGFMGVDHTSRMPAGRHVINVTADSLFQSFSEVAVIPEDATMSMPLEGDTVSMGTGFWVEWDNHGSKAFQTRVELASDSNPDLWVGDSSPDDGNYFLRIGAGRPLSEGPAMLRVRRENVQSHWLTEAYYVSINAATETVIPVMVVD